MIIPSHHVEPGTTNWSNKTIQVFGFSAVPVDSIAEKSETGLEESLPKSNIHQQPVKLLNHVFLLNSRVYIGCPSTVTLWSKSELLNSEFGVTRVTRWTVDSSKTKPSWVDQR
jgi:hypothetical protein